MNIHEPSTIEEAIDDLQTFLESDLWFSSRDEWKTEEDVYRYLEGHFNILREHIKKIQGDKQ